MNEQNNQDLEKQEAKSAEKSAEKKTLLDRIKKIPKKVRIISLISLAVILIAVAVIIILNTTGCAGGHHDYVETGSTAPTCTNSGTTTYSCTKCNLSYVASHSTPPLGHDLKDATCSSAPECKRCSAKIGSALSHQWGSSGICENCGYGVKFILPRTPVTVTCKSGYDKICKIESITIERTTLYSTYYELTFLVQSVYHENGDSYSDDAEFGWKLYDEDGMVVTSGTEYTAANIKVGEKSKATLILSVGSDVQDGKTYRLVILDLG